VQSEVIAGRLGSNGTVSVTDDLSASLDVAYSDDMTVSDLANKINEEAQSSYTKVLTSDTALPSASNVENISQTTNIGDLAGISVKKGDTITLTGTKRTGRSYQRVLTFDDGDSYSIQDILNQISVLNGGDVTASLDNTGHIVLMEQQSGSSKLALSIESTIDGLDFGTFNVTQSGRTSVNVEATVTSDNRLQITHKAYGSAKSFTVEGGNAIGIKNGTYSGVDIAGTINGVEGTGKGTALTASASDKASRDMIITSTITAAELAENGPLDGSITLVAGIAERMYSQLESLTDSVNGFIQSQLDSYETEQDQISTQIDNMTSRLEQRRELYVRRFTQLEVALSRLQSVQDQLTSSLGALR
jgi:flagellar hook-associated protein 2